MAFAIKEIAGYIGLYMVRQRVRHMTPFHLFIPKIFFTLKIYPLLPSLGSPVDQRRQG